MRISYLALPFLAACLPEPIVGDLERAIQVVDAETSALDGYDDSSGTVEARIAALERLIGEQQDEIATMRDVLDLDEATNIEQQVDALTPTDLTALAARVDAVDATSQENATTLATEQARIDNLEDELTGTASGTGSTRLDALVSDVSAALDTLSSHGGALATLSVDFTALQEEVVPSGDLDLSRLDLLESERATVDQLVAADEATRDWVDDQSFATQDFATTRGYLVQSDIDAQTFATEDFVATQGFADDAEVADNIDNIAALQSRLGNFQVIATDTTWTVAQGGADFATVSAAMESARDVRIRAGAILTLEVADGVYSEPDQILLDHPDHERLHIVGNTSDASLVTLLFTGTNGLHALTDGGVAWVEGLTIRGDDTPLTAGVIAAGTAVVVLYDGVVVRDFGRHGVWATGGGTIFADVVTVESCGQDGFHADTSSYIGADGSRSTDNAGHGFFASMQSSIDARGTYAHDNSAAGFWAEDSSAIRADSSDVIGGTYAAAADTMSLVKAGNITGDDFSVGGVMAQLGSVMLINHGVLSDIDGTGLAAFNGSLIFADLADLSEVHAFGAKANVGATISAYQTTFTDVDFTVYEAFIGGVIDMRQSSATNAASFIDSSGGSFVDRRGAGNTDAGGTSPAIAEIGNMNSIIR